MSSYGASEFKGTERFVVQSCLGTGGFGVVYKVFDRERNSLVALKTLTAGEAESLYAFKKEFRTLADITHPNLVGLYELLSEGDQWFFTMELIEGVNILDYIWRKSNDKDDISLEDLDSSYPSSDMITFDSVMPEIDTTPKVGGLSYLFTGAAATTAKNNLKPSPANFERLRLVLKQLVAGLHALHEAGKLHRDIKPSNILVTPQGRVVLLDFGLITELSEQKISEEVKTIVGTPAYMSPEQGTARMVSAASDWYSVGVIIYEALTKQLPFGDHDDSAVHILMSKMRSSLTPPSHLVADIPPDIEALCIDLLKPVSKDRPTGEQLVQKLVSGNVKRRPVVIITDEIKMIGREEQQQALQEAFYKVRDGQPVVLFVPGHAGIGKSTFIRSCLKQIQQQQSGLLVLSGRCYEQESVPYKALDSLMDELSQHLKYLPYAEVSSLIPEDIPALVRIFPVLKQVKAIASTNSKVLEIPDSQQLRQRAFLALRELFIRLAKKYHLILFIDDLQWGDLDSAILLKELLRPPDEPNLLFIACYSDEEDRENTLINLLLAPETEIGAEKRHLEIRELTLAQSCRLAETLLANTNLKDRAEAIAQESAGSPFFIYEFVRYSELGLDITSAASEDIQLDTAIASLADAITRHLTQLPEDARQTLEIIAIAGQPLERRVAKEAAQIGNNEPTIINLLRTQRLIKARASKKRYEIEPYHDFIRKAIVAQISPTTLIAQHSRLARALEQLGEGDNQQVAYHFELAQEYEKATHYTILAADQAAKLLAFEQAARLYQQALRLRLLCSEVNALSLPQTHTLRISLADALANAGNGLAAAESYLQSAQELLLISTNNLAVMKLQQRAAEEYLRIGYVDEGLKVLRQVLAKIGMKMPETPQRALLSLLIRRAWLLLRGYGFHETTEAELSENQKLQIDICWTASTALGIIDIIRGADFQTRHMLLALKAGEPYRLVRALGMETIYAASAGNHKQAKIAQLIRLIKQLVEKVNNPYAFALVDFSEGISACLLGDWQRAHQLCERAEKTLREECTGVTWEIATSLMFMLRPLYYLGELHKLNMRLQGLLNEAQQRGDLYTETTLRMRLNYLIRLSTDDTSKIEIELREMLEKWSREGFHVQHYWELVGQVEATMYRGEGEEGWIFLNYHWPALVKSKLLRVQYILIEMLHLRARSAIAALHQVPDPAPLLKMAEQDALKLSRESLPYAKAFALLVHAGIASYHQHYQQTLDLLLEAEKACQATNMQMFSRAIQYRRGQLLGGEAGALLLKSVQDWATTQRIKRPEAFFDMVLPGHWNFSGDR